VKENILTVSATKKEEDEARQYLYRGIATRSFERQFQLADYVRVEDARIKDGLLHIDLVREIPEAVKPRKIEIRAEGGGKLIEGQAKAA
jgi:molecular chaperone IbpA